MYPSTPQEMILTPSYSVRACMCVCVFSNTIDTYAWAEQIVVDGLKPKDIFTPSDDAST